MPAYRRYVESHIVQVRAHAGRYPFYILSGLYGLIPADKMIRNYDYVLVEDKVGEFAERVRLQMARRRIRTILYSHAPGTTDWGVYTRALNMAADLNGTQIINMMFPTVREGAAILPQVTDAPAIA